MRHPFKEWIAVPGFIHHRPDVSVNVVEPDHTLQLYHQRWGHIDQDHLKSKLADLGTKVKQKEMSASTYV